MNCYVCATQGRQQPAVAICRSCSSGLCLEHKRADAVTPGPGGMRHDCNHARGGAQR
jgi:hypothetical protein